MALCHLVANPASAQSPLQGLRSCEYFLNGTKYQLVGEDMLTSASNLIGSDAVYALTPGISEPKMLSVKMVEPRTFTITCGSINLKYDCFTNTISALKSNEIKGGVDLSKNSHTNDGWGYCLGKNADDKWVVFIYRLRTV